ncbi:hypothetical protein OAG62_01095 [bacterium]|nr:hypothetical protein [bacterium]
MIDSRTMGSEYGRRAAIEVAILDAMTSVCEMQRWVMRRFVARNPYLNFRFRGLARVGCLASRDGFVV